MNLLKPLLQSSTIKSSTLCVFGGNLLHLKNYFLKYVHSRRKQDAPGAGALPVYARAITNTNF